MDFAKPVKAISLSQDVSSTSDRRLIELENQVQCLMEAHLAHKQPIQVNKITSSCEICSGPHDTQYCMENLKQAFVDYASSRIDEAGGALPSDTLKNPKLNVNSTSSILFARSYPIVDPQCSSHPYNSINARPEEPEQTLEDEFKDLHFNLPVLEVLAHAPMYNAIMDKYLESLELGKNRLGNSEPFDILANLGACVNIILLYLFKKLKIRLLEETNHVFGLADGTKSYPIKIVKDVEVHIGRLKLLSDFDVIDMKKDLEPPLLVRRGFPATANAVINCRKAKITVGERITKSVFGVKGFELGQEEAPY
ncbi:MAK10-like protein [Tanacetum coccineum]